MLVGAGLRLWQYFADTSLWIDELALARNIIDRPVSALFGPLHYGQAAPLGFLLIEKAVTSFAGTGEMALRAFPLVSGLAALFLFWAVSKRILSGWAVPFAVGLFSLGIPFIYFSSVVKQYSTDGAAALLVLLAALDARRRELTLRRAWTLGLIGAAVMWLSQPAVIVLAGIGGGQLLLTLLERDRVSARRLCTTWVLWAASAAAVATHARWAVSGVDRAYLQWFWADGFMPFPPRALADVFWLTRKITWVFGAFAPGLGHTNGGLNYRWSPIFALVFAYGCWALWRKQRDAALFLLLPLGIAVALSAASIYPFTARLLAFLIPCLLLVTAAGAGHLLSNPPPRLQALSPLLLALLGGAPVFAVLGALPPSRVQEMRPVFEYFSERHQADDAIYVYHGAGMAFGYYAPRLGIRARDVSLGRCSLDDPRRYLRELDRFRGRPRVWVFLTHEWLTGEVELVRGYLNQIGSQIEELYVPASSGRAIEHAYGYLYDLSDQRKLGSATAEKYGFPTSLVPLPESVARLTCYGVLGGEP